MSQTDILKKSFTLIELLVVMAIIGLLTGIILISLKNVQNKAKDARIMEGIWQIRSITELIQRDYASYTNTCDIANTLNENAPSPYGEQLKILKNDIRTQQGTLNVSCYASSDLYCVSAGLTAAGGKWYCADSTGMATTTSGNTCDLTNKDCAL